MIYILWTILNIAIILLFYVICFKATKLLRERLGLFASIFFVCGLLSFMTSPVHTNNLQNENLKIKSWTYKLKNEIKPGTTKVSVIEVDKNLMSSIILFVQYAEDKNSNNNVATESNSTVQGFVSGYNWSVQNITVDTTTVPDKLTYTMVGTMQWQLLGTTIYLEPKIFRGVFETQK